MGKKHLILILKFLVSALLIYLLLQKIQFSEILLSIRKISFGTLILIILLDALGILIATFKWQILISRYRFSRILVVGMIGRFYSLVLPGQLPGEALKAYYLGKGQKDMMQITASVILDKICGVIGLLLTGVIGLFFTARNIPLGIILSLTITMATMIIFLLAVRIRPLTFLLERLLKWFSYKFKFFTKLSSHSLELIDEMKNYLDRPALIFGNIILACLYQLIGIFIILLIAGNLNLEVGFIDFCWIFAIVSVALLFPVTIGGLGLREGAFLGLLGWMSVSPDKALALSLSFFGIQILDALTGGILALLKSNNNASFKQDSALFK